VGDNVNQRIRELAEQAWDSITVQDGINDEALDKYDQNFAELIVLECVKAVMDGTKEGDHYAQRIENHFDNGSGGRLQFGVAAEVEDNLRNRSTYFGNDL
jgi:hypothetical protein